MVLFNMPYILWVKTKHICTYRQREREKEEWEKGRERHLVVKMRTYLLLLNSWRKNSVDERQLVLIKNEIAPLHAM